MRNRSCSLFDVKGSVATATVAAVVIAAAAAAAIAAARVCRIVLSHRAKFVKLGDGHNFSCPVSALAHRLLDRRLVLQKTLLHKGLLGLLPHVA